jgi:hypothetical protein
VDRLVLLAALCISLWPAVLGQAGDDTGDLPRVTNHRVTSQSAAVHLGTPFRLELLVAAPAKTRWTHPNLPLRLDDLTWRSVTVRAREAGRYMIILELQAFRAGPLTVPELPLRAELPSGESRPLPLPAVEVNVTRLTDEAPGTPRPVPPRMFLDLPESGWILYLIPAAGLVLGLMVLLVLRRRRRSARPSAAAAEEPPDLERFRQMLEDLWSGRERLGDDRLLAFGMVAVFRDYLSWRYDRDFHSWTSGEIVSFLREQAPHSSPAIDQLQNVLEAGDQLRFSPAGGTPFSLFSALRDLMERMGDRPERKEVADAGVQVT